MQNELELPLNMTQIKADILIAEKTLDELNSVDTHLAKYLRGLAAYHLQQASEKLIKIQIYKSGIKYDNSKIYKHSIGELMIYAEDLGLDLRVPSYIVKNAEKITLWESEGRYDVHMLVRKDTLISCIKTVKEWYEDLKKSGYR